MICASLLACQSGRAEEHAQEEQAVTGRELLNACQSPSNSATDGTQFCLSYIAGLVTTVSALQKMNPSEKLFCIDPKIVSLESVRGSVVDWLQTNEKRLAEDAYVLVSEALNRAYPCRAESNTQI